MRERVLTAGIHAHVCLRCPLPVPRPAPAVCQLECAEAEDESDGEGSITVAEEIEEAFNTLATEVWAPAPAPLLPAFSPQGRQLRRGPIHRPTFPSTCSTRPHSARGASRRVPRAPISTSDSVHALFRCSQMGEALDAALTVPQMTCAAPRQQQRGSRFDRRADAAISIAGGHRGDRSTDGRADGGYSHPDLRGEELPPMRQQHSHDHRRATGGGR